jgi:long-chain acyl-CoA synthetase
LLTFRKVHGDSFQPFLVAVAGIDREHFPPFASKVLKKTVPATDDQAILAACANKDVVKAILREMDKVAKMTKMTGYERVRNINLCLDPFTIENDILTPTLKMKRPQAAKAFKAEIDRMYEESNAEQPVKAKL